MPITTTSLHLLRSLKGLSSLQWLLNRAGRVQACSLPDKISEVAKIASCSAACSGKTDAEIGAEAHLALSVKGRAGQSGALTA